MQRSLIETIPERQLAINMELLRVSFSQISLEACASLLCHYNHAQAFDCPPPAANRIDIPAQGLIGLIEYSYHQDIYFFVSPPQRTLRLSVLGPE
jgi:hypothetical protein